LESVPVKSDGHCEQHRIIESAGAVPEELTPKKLTRELAATKAPCQLTALSGIMPHPTLPFFGLLLDEPFEDNLYKMAKPLPKL
jgi:hypothetical protein